MPTSSFVFLERLYEHLLARVIFDQWLGELTDDLGTPDALIVLSETEQLTEDQAAAVSDLLIAASAGTEPHSRVAITINSTTPSALRSVFPRTVVVPPLRHHIDDLPSSSRTCWSRSRTVTG